MSGLSLFAGASLWLLASGEAVAASSRAKPKNLLTQPEPPAAQAARLTAFGIEITAESGYARVNHVLSGSPAASLGLKPADVLVHLAGEEVRDAASAARALDAVKPQTRLWAVVRRGRDTAILESDLPELRLANERGPEALSPAERERQREHLDSARSREAEVLRGLKTPRLAISAGQRTWVQFPAGLPDTLQAGDLVEGLMATGLAAGPDLDYLAVPPQSRVWAEVSAATIKDRARTLRLHIFKLKLRGGHAYPISARVVDASGDRLLTQVSPGGTLVTAEDGGLGPDTRVQIELIKPVVLFEGPAYYQAGPGLWPKLRISGPERALDVSHVIPGRSAERAGIQPGDSLLSIDGTPADKLDFTSALERLYGPPGTPVNVRVEQGGKTLEMSLTRGVRYRDSVGIDIDWSADGPGLLVREVANESPAELAGVRPGDRLVSFGALPTEEIPAPRLKELLLKRDLIDDNEVTVRSIDGSERRVSLKRAPTRAPLPPPYKT